MSVLSFLFWLVELCSLIPGAAIRVGRVADLVDHVERQFLFVVAAERVRDGWVV